MKKSSWAAIDPDPKLKKNPSIRVLTIVDKKKKSIVGKGATSSSPSKVTESSLNVTPNVDALSSRPITREATAPTSQIVITNGAPVNRSQSTFPALPAVKKPERVSISKKPNSNQGNHAWTSGTNASIDQGGSQDGVDHTKKGKKKKILMKFG
jgi:hypothetical protein